MIAWIARSPTPGYGPRGRHFVFGFSGFWFLLFLVVVVGVFVLLGFHVILVLLVFLSPFVLCWLLFYVL